MLPIYKLISLLMRVFSRPFINLSKKYYTSKTINNTFSVTLLCRLGNWFHAFEVKINRKYLKTESLVPIKTLSQQKALDKGIQFFYQILFYLIAIGYPTYELYRAAVDTKKKQVKNSQRMDRIEEKVSTIDRVVMRLETDIAEQGNIFSMNCQMIQRYTPSIQLSILNAKDLAWLLA